MKNIIGIPNKPEVINTVMLQKTKEIICQNSDRINIGQCFIDNFRIVSLDIRTMWFAVADATVKITNVGCTDIRIDKLISIVAHFFIVYDESEVGEAIAEMLCDGKNNVVILNLNNIIDNINKVICVKCKRYNENCKCDFSERKTDYNEYDNLLNMKIGSPAGLFTTEDPYDIFSTHEEEKVDHYEKYREVVESVIVTFKCKKDDADKMRKWAKEIIEKDNNIPEGELAKKLFSSNTRR